jgi:hypothetical protein
MCLFGIAADTPTYDADGVISIKVRIPTLHGAWDISDYSGKTNASRAYDKRVADKDLPLYQALQSESLRMVEVGDILLITTIDGSKSGTMFIMGRTGSTIYKGGLT